MPMQMPIDAAMEAVRNQMPEKRWRHTLGVVDSAVRLAERFGENIEKTRAAALLHDAAKAWPVEKQRQAILADGDPAGLEALEYDKELWHAHAGAWTARRDFGVEDADVLNAIRYHTSGRIGMSRLEKIVCLADYIEPGRDFPGVDRLRELAAAATLEEALLEAFDGTLRVLLERRRIIFPLTVLARNDLLSQIRSGGY